MSKKTAGSDGSDYKVSIINLKCSAARNPDQINYLLKKPTLVSGNSAALAAAIVIAKILSPAFWYEPMGIISATSLYVW